MLRDPVTGPRYRTVQSYRTVQNGLRRMVCLNMRPCRSRYGL